MAYDTTEAVAKFLSGFQMEITNRERDTVAPDYYVKYSLTLSKGGKDFSTTFVSDPRAFGEPTVTQVFSALADEILNDLSYDEDYAPTDDAKDTIMGAVSAAFEERYGEDFAEVATDFGQDIDDIAGRANPYVLSVDTVRAVNEKGYDAVFAEQWKAELSECDIDPEAVSVDSEAHDMENGRDGLDGNAPEKDAPEKDDRDAQPPVDTDNR